MKNKIVLGFAVLLLALVGTLDAALEEDDQSFQCGGNTLFLYEDTSAANAILTLTTTSKGCARHLRSVSIECSTAVTITPTVVFTRTQITSGTISVSLPDVPLTAATSAAMFLSLPMRPTDVIVVTVQAAGAGETCTAQVIEVAP